MTTFKSEMREELTDEVSKELLKLSEKEEILSRIIVWLKTKGLYEECLKIVAPDLLTKRREG